MGDWYYRDGARQNSLKVCPGCRNLVRSNEEFCPFCARRLRAEGGLRGVWKKVFSYPDAVTRFLLGFIVLVFLLQIVADVVTPGSGRNQGLMNLLTAKGWTYIRMGSNFHPFVLEFHQYWRWITSCFLHFGVIHILFNSWCLWDLGRLAERMWGGRQVFAAFILTGAAGSALSFGWGILRDSPANSAGASGAICGLLGLFLGSYYKNRYAVGEFLGGQLVKWAVYILVFGLVMRADNAAHVGGMLAGAVLGYFLMPTHHTRSLSRDMKIWNTLAILASVMFVVSIGFAVWFFIVTIGVNPS